MSFVNNENILQACATVFAGVLILLTIERKSETKNVEPEYMHKLIRRRSEISTYLQNQRDEIQRIDKDLRQIEGGKDSMTVKRLNDEKAEIIKKVTEVENDLNLTNNTIKQVLEQERVTKVEEERIRRLKNIEDFITLLTLALFSVCIVFMIFVDTDWNFYTLDYSLTSKFLFSIALLVLIIRVFLRGTEPRRWTP